MKYVSKIVVNTHIHKCSIVLKTIFFWKWVVLYTILLQFGLDVMTAAMSYFDWKKVADTMAEQKQLIYIEYLADLNVQKETLAADQAEMQVNLILHSIYLFVIVLLKYHI